MRGHYEIPKTKFFLLKKKNLKNILLRKYSKVFFYIGSRHGQRAGVSECIEGHAGPITSVACHSVPGAVDFSHLYLTASVDWSVKLWSLKVIWTLY